MLYLKMWGVKDFIFASEWLRSKFRGQEFEGTNFQVFKYPEGGELKFRIDRRISMKFVSIPASYSISLLKETSTTFKPHK